MRDCVNHESNSKSSAFFLQNSTSTLPFPIWYMFFQVDDSLIGSSLIAGIGY